MLGFELVDELGYFVGDWVAWLWVWFSVAFFFRFWVNCVDGFWVSGLVC